MTITRRIQEKGEEAEMMEVMIETGKEGLDQETEGITITRRETTTTKAAQETGLSVFD